MRAASNRFIAFLDDDDLFYPEHLATLANAAQSAHVAWYSDAVSAFLRPGENGSYETHSRLRLYAQDYDRELLLLDNYIPLTTLLLERETFLELGGFDAEFDLFEDWDFLIRLSQRGTFLRVPRITCEVRHFEGGSSVVLAAPEGSPRFRAAKLQVWRKHSALIDNDVIANVFERQKRRGGALYSDLVEAKGRAEAAQIEIARATREGIETANTINGYALRVRELEAALAATQSASAAAAQASLVEMQDLVGRLDDKTIAIERLARENNDLRAANTEAAARRDREAARRDRTPERSARDDLSLEDVEGAHDDREAARARLSRVLLLCPEPLGHGQPAGIGIRFVEIARVLLADGHSVTVLSPDAGAVKGCRAEPLETFVAASQDHDVAVVQGHVANAFFQHAHPIPTVIDLYDPFIIENLHYYAERGDEVFQHDHATLMESLAHGDYFLCASEAQRLFYLGLLLASDPESDSVRGGPAAESLIGIAPFGVQPPRPAKSRDLTSPAILFGGIYDWYDPIAAIDA